MREAVGFQANHSHSIENAALHSQNTFESDSLDIKIQALDEYRRLWYNIAIVWACLSEERIRHICRDSRGNIWVSGYGAHGLVRIAPDGTDECVSNADESLSGLKYRFVTELSDGRLLASVNSGLIFLQDGKPVSRLTEADGLSNQTILSVMEREDGTILAGSDGDGVYIIKNDKIAGHIGAGEGLDSNVVMRIMPCIFIPKNQKTLTISGRTWLSGGAFGGMGEGVLFSGTSRKQRASFIL